MLDNRVFGHVDLVALQNHGRGDDHREIGHLALEIVDHGESQSVVKHGPLAGQTLGQLVEQFGPALLGKRCLDLINDPTRPENLIGRFPLLLKFLDAEKSLSVQVHPDDQKGATLSPPDLGKTEAWYVLEANPGAKIYAGLLPGVSKDDFQSAIKNDTAESVLNSIEPQPGDCIFIPAGTVHAIGAGLLIAEIQQCSNTTFRLYDWGRVDKNGKPRELHIDQGIESTDFSLGPSSVQQPTPANEYTESIVDCDKFKLSRLKLEQPVDVATAGSFKILVVTKGSVTVTGDPSEIPLERGDTCLIPAELETVNLGVDSESELLLISSD